VHGGPALPLGNVEQPPQRTAVHSIRPVDTNGRVVDKSVLTALDWRPGDLLSWRVSGGLIVITRPGYGRRGITKYGHLALPAAMRRGAGIRIHDRLLLAADPEQALLVVYPAHVLDEILARRFAEGARG
jgi:bifunctional DNA-binding transcriptional regulator/antitoxin component of YhaV-PrlF toxin-antitoxin module